MSENLTYTLNVNGVARTVTADGDLPLLWLLRDVIGATGTKFGCGITACKACSVLVDGVLERSCDFDAKNAAGRNVLTVEGLAATPIGKKLQQAWIDEQVPQCGYCQSGMLIAATALLTRFPQPSDENIREYMDNICVCGTYQRVRRAIRRAAGLA